MFSLLRKSKEQRRAEAEVLKFKNDLGPFVTAAESTRMPMVFTNANVAENPIIFANDSFLRLTGYDRDDLLGRAFGFLAAKNADRDLFDGDKGLFDSQVHDGHEAMFRRKDGSDFCGAIFISPVLDEVGTVVQHFLSLINLTKYKNSEEALRFSEGRFRLAVAAAKLGVADIDLLSHQEHWSDELRAMLGVSLDVPASTKTYLALVHPADQAAVSHMHLRSMRGELVEGDEGLYRVVRPEDGAVRWIASERHAMRDPNGDVVRVVVTHRDITETKAEHDRVLWSATHDYVTGLPNRAFFRAQLETALAVATASNSFVGMLLIDLDRFKHINDLLGHQAGDDALSKFAARIAAAMPQGATLARLGGDEFAAILPGINMAAANAIAEGLMRRLELPFSIGGRAMDLHASIGISAFPLHGKGPSQLIHSADLALYSAKKAGGSRVRAFVPELRAERQQQLAMLRHAHSVLDKDRIEPFYQPKIVLATGKMAGLEALLRWRHPRVGLQLPKTIAYAFDDIHTAGLLGDAMAEAVLSDMRRWIESGISIGKVAMNASAAELRDPAYAARLLERLGRHGVPAKMLELEITETAFLDDRASSVITMLMELRSAGMTVALDDFGTGFSSLSHIRDFPVDTIKIDRSFVAGLDKTARDRAITEAVLLLGSALGMTTVAEGVETQAQADFLMEHGCMLAQGFLYAPALEASAIEGEVLARC